MKRIILFAVVAAVAAVAGSAYRSSQMPDAVSALTAGRARDYPIIPVLFTEVELHDGFWATRIETNREVTIPFALEQNEITGRIDNFLLAAGLKEGNYDGERYNDTDVYKVLEGAAFSLALHLDPVLDAYLDEVIATIAAAQEEDGYLFTASTAPSEELPVGIGEERWVNLAVSHELYNAGHLYEAAVAHYQATGKHNFLDIALKNADLIYDTFGTDKIRDAPGHQVIEMGLVKLYRVTADERYLELAQFFLEQRGKNLTLKQYPEGHRFDIYNDPVQIQAHAPLLEQTEAVGHSVRAMYQYSGMADVAAITGDARFAGAMEALWEDVVARKMYITGGLGSRHGVEGFGDAYELPNDTGYAETCASIGLVYWSWRLFLTHGDAQYLDVLERVLYNGLIVGVSADGDEFFYPNPMSSDGEWGFNQGEATRKPWFGTACCPGNLTRFLPAVPGYIYAQRDGAVYIANYIASATTVAVATADDAPVTLTQTTNYPWDGAVRVDVDPVRPTDMSLRLRIPGWARDQPVPSDLYRYLGAPAAPVVVRVNGENFAYELVDGFAVLDRTWAPGDVVELDLPMAVRTVVASEVVAADRGRVALERGPIVYAVEGADNDGHALDVAVVNGDAFAIASTDVPVAGIVVLRGPGMITDTREPIDLTAIPYFAWSHRGPGKMAVWLHGGDER